MKILTWRMIPFLLTNMNSLKSFFPHPAGEYSLREKGDNIVVIISSAGAGICLRLYFCMKCIQPLPIFLDPGS